MRPLERMQDAHGATRLFKALLHMTGALAYMEDSLGTLNGPQSSQLCGHHHEPISVQRAQEVCPGATDISLPLLRAHRKALHHPAHTAQIGTREGKSTRICMNTL